MSPKVEPLVEVMYLLLFKMQSQCTFSMQPFTVLQIVSWHACTFVFWF